MMVSRKLRNYGSERGKKTATPRVRKCISTNFKGLGEVFGEF